jgi:hypothetical protein
MCANVRTTLHTSIRQMPTWKAYSKASVTSTELPPMSSVITKRVELRRSNSLSMNYKLAHAKECTLCQEEDNRQEIAPAMRPRRYRATAHKCEEIFVRNQQETSPAHTCKGYSHPCDNIRSQCNHTNSIMYRNEDDDPSGQMT